MAYFRECPARLKENSDFEDIFFEFANTYTEESVRNAYQKMKQNEENKKDKDFFRNLGYSEEEISNMNLKE